MMKILGNIIWLVFGGLGIAVEYFVSSLLMMITTIGIHLAGGCFWDTEHYLFLQHNLLYAGPFRRATS